MQRINLPVAVEIGNIEVDDLSLSIDQNKMALAQFKSAVSLDNENACYLLRRKLMIFLLYKLPPPNNMARNWSSEKKSMRKADRLGRNRANLNSATTSRVTNYRVAF